MSKTYCLHCKKDTGNTDVKYVIQNERKRMKSICSVCKKPKSTFVANKKSSKTSSKYKGVFWNKKMQKWRAQVRFEGKNYHLGYFTSEIEAALAYNTAALNFFKTFAKLNIIE